MLKATFSSTCALLLRHRSGTFDRSILLNVMVDTHDGYTMALAAKEGFKIVGTLTIWSGPGAAPTVVLRDFDNSVARSVARICQRVGTVWLFCNGYYGTKRYYGCPRLASRVTAADGISGEERTPRRIRAAQLPEVR